MPAAVPRRPVLTEVSDEVALVARLVLEVGKLSLHIFTWASSAGCSGGRITSAGVLAGSRDLSAAGQPLLVCSRFCHAAADSRCGIPLRASWPTVP
jgi:hypothetical protein